MSDIYQDIKHPDVALGQIYKGTIHTQPLNFSARMDVIIPDINENLVFHNVRWQARDNMTLPQTDDDVLVVFDNQNEPWVISWWPAVRTPQVYSGPLADGPPPAPVDDDIWIQQDADSSDNSYISQYDDSDNKWDPILGTPRPVQNGQWVKGVGGVPVWQNIVVGDITQSANGQFVKGTGGPAVWSPILQSDLPYNLIAQGAGYQPPNGDWNQVAANGWYMMPGGANAPDGNWYLGFCIIHNPAWQQQFLWGFTQNPTPQWQRGMYNGSWSGWSQRPTQGGQRIECGTIYIGPGPNSRYNVATNFAQPFTSNPTVVATADSTPSGDTSPNSSNLTNFSVMIYAINTATVWFTVANQTNGAYGMYVRWIAMGT